MLRQAPQDTMPVTCVIEKVLRESLGIFCLRNDISDLFAYVCGDDVAAKCFLTSLANKLRIQQFLPIVMKEYSTFTAFASHIEEILKIKNMRVLPRMLNALDDNFGQICVALTGCSCRFPNHDTSYMGFVDLLLCGKSVGSDLPTGRSYIGKGEFNNVAGFLDAIAYFDNVFFKICPRESTFMDPQQRLLLQGSFDAVKNSGSTVERLKEGQTAVLVGMWSSDYATGLSTPNGTEIFAVTGTSNSVSAGHISYFFDITGPAMAVDTSFSSAAVAVHLGASFIKRNDCQLAICAATNLCYGAQIFDVFRKNKLLSSSNTCKTFDLDADGYMRSEGIAVTIFEPLDSTMKTMAVLAGSACNQDGKSDSLLAPNLNSQVAVAQDAFASCNFHPDTRYVEAHGTGTVVGDKTEMNSIALVHGEQRSPVLVSSVKSLIGHTEACAGLAGLLRSVSLFSTQAGPHLHVSKVRQSCFILPSIGHRWVYNRCCTNSYGFSGTNVTLVTDNIVVDGDNSASEKPAFYILPFSAKSASALQLKIKNYHLLLAQSHTQPSIYITAAQQMVEDFSHRALTFGYNKTDLVNNMELGVDVKNCENTVWLFTGRQNSTRLKSGRMLRKTIPSFEIHMQHCQKLAAHSILNDDHKSFDAECKEASILDTSEVHAQQTELMSLQYSLSELWRSVTCDPHVVLGHSFGECMAMTVAGFINIQDACWLIKSRALAVAQFVSVGNMVATNCTKRQAHLIVGLLDMISIGCYNCPNQHVFSGETLSLCSMLDWCGFRITILNNKPFHSPKMLMVGQQLGNYIETINFESPILSFLSTLSGTFTHELNANYCATQIANPVLFSQAVNHLLDVNVGAKFLEVGPHPLLLDLVRMCNKDRKDQSFIELLPSLRQNFDDWICLSQSLRQFYMDGLKINFRNLHRDFKFSFALPPYPFDKQYFWLHSNNKNLHIESNQRSHYLKVESLQNSASTKQDCFKGSEIRTQIEKALKIVLHLPVDNNVDGEIGFIDLGLDSLVSEEFCDLLQKKIDRKIDATILFDHPTVSSLTKYLCDGPNLKLHTKTLESIVHSDIFITGVSCVLPNEISTVSKLWDSLTIGADAVCPIPIDHFDLGSHYDPDVTMPNKTYVRDAACLLNSAHLRFDPLFFHISPREASVIDPHHRMVLQNVWHAIENSVMDHTDLCDSDTCIFIGCMNMEFQQHISDRNYLLSSFDFTGSGSALCAGRLAFFLGTKGPAVVTNTACSSSLVAIDCAVLELNRSFGTCAIVAGIDLLLSPASMIMRAKSRVLSPDCHCKTMDQTADGYARGEGIASLIISTSKMSIEDSFPKILTSKTNQDGRSSGLTAPNGLAQQRLISHIYEMKPLNCSVGFAELHGTGTALGDPVETRSYSAGSNQISIIVGSFKTNIGHTEGAAGAAGLLKVLISMKCSYIPLHRNWSILNKHIDSTTAPLVLPIEGHVWQLNPMATVSSFGYSGTNCCLLVQQARSAQVQDHSTLSQYLFPISSKTSLSLEQLRIAWHRFMLTNVANDQVLALVCAAAMRTHFACRGAVVVKDNTQLLHFLANSNFTSMQKISKKVCFLYTGQSDICLPMGEQLSEECDVFSQIFVDIEHMCELSVFPLKTIIENQSLLAQEMKRKQQTSIKQLTLLCLEYSLSKQWEDWGMNPNMVIGHSLGEVVAASVAGMIQLADAVKLTKLRGIAMEIGTGCMSTVTMSYKNATRFAVHMRGCWVAANNAPTSSTMTFLNEVAFSLSLCIHELGHKQKIVNKQYGFHCPLMQTAASKLYSSIGSMTCREGSLDVFSNVTGGLLKVASPGYWCKQIIKPVNFYDCVRSAVSDGADTFLEISAHAQLLPLLPLIITNKESQLLASLLKHDQDLKSMFATAAKLFCSSCNLHWNAIYKRYQIECLWKVPNYVFDQQLFLLPNFEKCIDSKNEQQAKIQCSSISPVQLNTHSLETSNENKLFSIDSVAYNLVWLKVHILPVTYQENYLIYLMQNAGKIHCRISQALDNADVPHEAFRMEMIQCRPMHATKSIRCVWTCDRVESELFYLSSLIHFTKILKNTMLHANVCLITTVSRCFYMDSMVSCQASTSVAFTKYITNQKISTLCVLVTKLDSIASFIDHNNFFVQYHSYQTLVVSGSHTIFEECIERNSSCLHKDFIGSFNHGAPAMTLVTGGVSGLGMETAKHVYSRHHTLVTLISRRSPLRNCNIQLGMLQTHNNIIICCECDITKRKVMRNVMMQNDFLSVAFCHSAAATNNAYNPTLSYEIVKQLLAAKSAAAVNAQLLCLSYQCNNILLYSSVSVLLGSTETAPTSFGIYSASNSVLDSIAQWGMQHGHQVASIAWGSWKSVGMVGHLSAALEKQGITGLINEEGIVCINHVLAKKQFHTVFVHADWKRILLFYKHLQHFVKLVVNASELEFDEHEFGKVGVNDVEPTLCLNDNSVRTKVESLLKSLLHIDEAQSIDFDTGFMDLGMDSLTAIEFHDKLERLFHGQCDVPFTICFDYPTVSQIVKYFDSQVASHGPALTETFNPPIFSFNGHVSAIGLACNLPKTSNSLTSLSQFLISGVDGICHVLTNRYDIKPYYDPNNQVESKCYVMKAAFLVTSVALFDCGFFNISPREAVIMDPQQRLLLQTAWHATENSAVKEKDLREKNFCICIGSTHLEYENYVLADEDLTPSLTGSGSAISSGRLAYFFGTTGCSLAVDTACSSSLIALHLAYQQIMSQTCDQGLSAGVDLMFSPLAMVKRCKSMMLSPDCHCKTLDNDADGYARGEGCVVIMLQSSLVKSDNLFATINASASNQDGRSSGLTAPSGTAQQNLIKDMVKAAESSSISYMEIHGTGTALGDPIELSAITSALATAGYSDMILGTIKTSVGHTENASGAAGLAKLLLAQKTTYLPLHRNFKFLNKKMSMGFCILALQEGCLIDAGFLSTVSSFGFSGTNCCMLLRGATALAVISVTQSVLVLPLSAKTDASLDMISRKWYTFLQIQSTCNINLLVAQAASNCAHFHCRRVYTAKNAGELCSSLLQTGLTNRCKQQQNICFLFTGQGIHSLIQRQLLYEYPQFNNDYTNIFQTCGLQPAFLSSNLQTISEIMKRMFEGDEKVNAQPLLFCLEYSLAQLWKSWGLHASMIVGHSLGELIGATFGGMIEFKDSANMIVSRGKAMHYCSGATFSCDAGPFVAEKIAYSCTQTWLAAVNAPRSSAFSVQDVHMSQFCNSVAELGFKNKKVTNYTPHCPLMQKIANDLFHQFDATVFHQSKIAFYSNVTGEIIQCFDAQYWRDQIVKSVKFSDCINSAIKDGAQSFLEIGPHPVLLPLVHQIKRDCLGCSSLNQKEFGLWSLLSSAGKLYSSGFDFCWQQMYNNASSGAVWMIPNYVFDEQEYWQSFQNLDSSGCSITSAGVAPLSQMEKPHVLTTDSSTGYGYVTAWTKIPRT